MSAALRTEQLFGKLSDCLIFLQVCIYIVCVRAFLRFNCFIEHVEKHADIESKSDCAYDGINSGAKSRLNEILALVLESREGLSEHTPKSESLRSVLELGALSDCECAESWSDEQRKTGIPRMAGNAFVCICKIPKVIRNNSEPKHIRPEHIATAVLLRNYRFREGWWYLRRLWT